MSQVIKTKKLSFKAKIYISIVTAQFQSVFQSIDIIVTERVFF